MIQNSNYQNLEGIALLDKYNDIVDLLKTEKLSIRRISSLTNRSINTVRKVKYYIASPK